MIPHVLKTLLLELAHETTLHPNLRKEEVFLYAVKFPRHACADERCDVDVTLSTKYILTANHAAISKD